MMLLLNIELILVFIRFFVRTSARTIINRLILANGLLLVSYGIWPEGINWNLMVLDRTIISSGIGILIISLLILRYRNIQSAPVSPQNFVFHIISWLIYIFCYEVFFRGFLLFKLADNWGSVVSILINIALYTGIHSIKDEHEFRWSLPFGCVLIASTVWCQNFIPAFIIHSALSITVLLQDQFQYKIKFQQNE